MTFSFKNIEKKFYQNFYEGQIILIKISGAEICSLAMKDMMRALRWMISKHIRIVLVFGGGEQIDTFYFKNTGIKDRPKIHGIAITTKSVLEKGAIPAYEYIEKHLKKLLKKNHLLDKAKFISPSDIRAVRKSAKTGRHTGTLKNIRFDIDNKLTFLGFLASGKDNKVRYCINADEVATFFVEHYRISELFFITKTGGVLDARGNLVNTLGTSSIQKILVNKHPTIHVDGGMKKKMQEIARLLQFVSKIAVTNLAGILDEITKLEGHGSLCVNLSGARIEQCKNFKIFDALYEHFIIQGIWKKRNKYNHALVRDYHFLLTLGGSPLGGYSLLPKNYPLQPKKRALSIECLWSGKERNGIGRALIEKAILESALQEMPLFLYTKQNMTKFAKGFIHHPERKSSSGATLWVREI